MSLEVPGHVPGAMDASGAVDTTAPIRIIEAKTLKDDGVIIGRKIGEGKFSHVYEATVGETKVALKEILCFSSGMNESDRKALLNELRLLQALEHPNIITYMSCYQTEDNKFYIMMELATADLAKLLKKAKGPLAEKTVWKLFVQIARALRYMHGNRVMHRDLKPANVFISDRGLVKLGDLGLGRAMSSGTFELKTLVGTPYYMSPELINEQPYEFKSDIWSLGCLLYEMVTLRNPFFEPGLDFMGLAVRINNATYPPIAPEFSAALSSLIGRMIVADAASRHNIDEVYRIAKEQVTMFAES